MIYNCNLLQLKQKNINCINRSIFDDFFFSIQNNFLFPPASLNVFRDKTLSLLLMLIIRVTKTLKLNIH